MKKLSLFLLFFLPYTVIAQTTKTTFTLKIDEACSFDSIMVVSMVTSQVAFLSRETKQTIPTFDPLDILVFRSMGGPSQAMKFNVYVEGPVMVKIQEKQGCNNIIVQSKADERMEELGSYLSMDANEQSEALLPLLRKNLDAIHISGYLNHYMESDFVQPETSRAIVELFKANPNSSNQHSFIQPILSRIRLLYDSVQFQLPDSILVKYLREWPGEITKKTPKYRLYDFWFTTCAPCLKDHKLMKTDIEANTFPNEVKIIGIATDPNLKFWNTFMEKTKLPWENYWTPIGIRDTIMNKYGIVVFPTYFLVNEEGTILSRFNSYSQLAEILTNLEAEE